MAMQGKSTSGDKPSLDIDEAELAANTFRPSWDADDFDSDGAPIPVAAPAGAAMGATLIHGSASMPNVPAAESADSTQLGVAPASPEVLDSASLVEATRSLPHAPVTAPLPTTPDSSPSVGQRAADPMTATSSARAAAVTQASAAKPSDAAYAAADPFRQPVPAPESNSDLNFVRKPLSKSIVFAAMGVVALVAVGLFVTFGSASPEEPETKSAVRPSIGPVVPAPTNDIPPPPPKDETTPPKTAATLASEATPVPSPAKAAESLPPRSEPSTPKTTANAPPTHSELKPKAAPVTPKTPPKATGGGIVRDSPF